MDASALDQPVLSDSEIEQVVVEVVGALAPDKGVEVSQDTALIDHLGYESAQMIELGFALERRLGCQLKQTQLGAATVADVIAVVRAAYPPESG